MTQPEARITIDRNPKPPDLSKSSAAKMVEASNAAEQMRARRAQIHKQAEIDAGGGGLPDLHGDPDPTPEREDIESIEFRLRDGRLIEYGPPTNISLSDRIARLYSARSFAEGGPDPGITEFRLTRLLMGVRAIDGRPTRPITNLIERTRLANELGDQALEIIHVFDRKHWPPLQETELPLVEKKFRT